MNEFIYLHELVEIRLQNRANYMDHMASYAPTARTEKGMRCLGIWGTVGSTERWPETVNMWELDGWHGMAANFRYELNHPTLQDPTMAEWWSVAQEYRSGGLDRIMLPAAYSPTLEECVERRLHGETYYHEVIQLVPGQAKNYLAAFEQEWLPLREQVGLRLVGAYRTAHVNDSEVIVLSAIDTWDTWADIEEWLDSDPEVMKWKDSSASMVVDWRNKLLCASPSVPMRTGKML